MEYHDVKQVARQLGWMPKMRKLQFLALGPLNEVVIEGLEGLTTKQDFESRYPRFSAKVEAEIKKRWQSSPSDPVAALRYFIVLNKLLVISVVPAGFHQYIGTKRSQPRDVPVPVIYPNEDWPTLIPLDRELIMPISFGAVVVSSDNFIPIGIRAKHLAVGARKLAVMPSGFFDPVNEVVKVGPVGKKQPVPSLLSSIASELWEEMRIAWYNQLTLLGLVHDRIDSQQPQIQVRIRVPFSKRELEEKLKMMLKLEGREAEISSYDFVENSIWAVRDYPGNWALHAAANLMLHFALP